MPFLLIFSARNLFFLLRILFKSSMLLTFSRLASVIISPFAKPYLAARLLSLTSETSTPLPSLSDKVAPSNRGFELFDATVWPLSPSNVTSTSFSFPSLNMPILTFAPAPRVAILALS